MSRENTPATGYMVECSREGQTWMLGLHSPFGFRALVMRDKIAEDVAKALTRMDDVTYRVVPAPAPHIASVP